MTDAVIHVIDDDAAMRDSLVFLLESAGHSARSYDSAGAFLDALSDLPPGCIVTDIRMPDMSGLDLVRRLKELGIRLPVIVITGHGDVPLAVEAMKAGVIDFLEKPFDDSVMLEAIRTALQAGETQQREEGRQAEIRERIATLSAREREVLDRLVLGRPNKVIAGELGISARTVEIYRANVMTKMRAGSLSELVRMALLAEGG
jgi:two-component system response regulator FixJ